MSEDLRLEASETPGRMGREVAPMEAFVRRQLAEGDPAWVIELAISDHSPRWLDFQAGWEAAEARAERAATDPIRHRLELMARSWHNLWQHSQQPHGQDYETCTDLVCIQNREALAAAEAHAVLEEEHHG